MLDFRISVSIILSTCLITFIYFTVIRPCYNSKEIGNQMYTYALWLGTHWSVPVCSTIGIMTTPSWWHPDLSPVVKRCYYRWELFAIIWTDNRGNKNLKLSAPHIKTTINQGMWRTVCKEYRYMHIQGKVTSMREGIPGFMCLYGHLEHFQYYLEGNDPLEATRCCFLSNCRPNHSLHPTAPWE